VGTPRTSHRIAFPAFTQSGPEPTVLVMSFGRRSSGKETVCTPRLPPIEATKASRLPSGDQNRFDSDTSRMEMDRTRS